MTSCSTASTSAKPIEAEVAKDHLSLANLTRGETLYFKPKAGQPLIQQR